MAERMFASRCETCLGTGAVVAMRPSGKPRTRRGAPVKKICESCGGAGWNRVMERDVRFGEHLLLANRKTFVVHFGWRLDHFAEV